MTGTGTENDPYLVKTINDFMSLDGRTGYAKLNNDIDFNDHPTLKYGIDFVAHAGSLHFDGNKKQIRNLVFKDFSGSRAGSAIEFGWMHDTYFVNMVCMHCEDTTGNYPLINIKNENIHNSFNMMVMSPVRFSTHIPRNMNECTWNFTLQGYNDKLNFESFEIKRTRIHLDFENTSTYSSDIITNAILDTCIIDGTIKSSNDRYLLDRGCNFSNCMFNVDVDSGNLKLNYGTNYPSFTGVNIFNSDKVTFVPTPSLPGFNYITDERMRDNNYLQSIGFPVTPKIVGE